MDITNSCAATTSTNGHTVAYGPDHSLPYTRPLYRVWLDGHHFSACWQHWRMRCLYLWLISGSSEATSTNVCVKTWLQLGWEKDPKAISVIRLAEDVCLNQIPTEEEAANAIAIIEAHIATKFPHATN